MATPAKGHELPKSGVELAAGEKGDRGRASK
jgi:hypothetical protein